jgi:hypothetical protein
MGELLSIGTKAKSIDAISVLRKVLDETNSKEFFITLNTRAQLFDKGEDRDGVKIQGNSANYLEGGAYSQNTISGVPGLYEGKIAKGLPTDRITLYDTGKFYESFKISLQGLSYIIEANDLKDGKSLTNLISNGVKILGLNENNTRIFEDYLLERVIHLIIQDLFS